MQINTLTKNFLKKNVAGYVSKDQEASGLRSYLRLDLGENLLGCSPKVLAALRAIGPQDLRLYPDPSGAEIKRVISNLYKVSCAEIAIANSSNEIIDFLPKMILEKNDRAIVILPTFFRFIEATISAGGRISSIKLNEETGFKINDSISKMVLKKIENEGARLVWICNPNNPTGEIWPLEQIKAIASKTKAFVVVDEAFWEYYDPGNKKSAVTLVRKNPNILVLRTLSKAYGLAGLRFGYTIANKKTITIIEKYRNTLLMTSRLIQKLAKVAFSDQKFVRQTIKKTTQLRQNLFNQITQIDDLHLGAQSKTNVFLLRHRKKDLYQELLKRGVKTADFRDCLGLKGKGYVRITVGPQRINNFLVKTLHDL